MGKTTHIYKNFYFLLVYVLFVCIKQKIRTSSCLAIVSYHKTYILFTIHRRVAAGKYLFPVLQSKKPS